MHVSCESKKWFQGQSLTYRIGFLAESWHVTSKGMFAGSCIGVICLVISLEFLRRIQRVRPIQRRFRLKHRHLHVEGQTPAGGLFSRGSSCVQPSTCSNLQLLTPSCCWPCTSIVSANVAVSDPSKKFRRLTPSDQATPSSSVYSSVHFLAHSSSAGINCSGRKDSSSKH